MPPSQARPVARLRRLGLVAALILTGVAGWHGPPTAALAEDVPVTIMGAGDIAGGNLLDSGSTGDLIRAANPSAVFTVGDNAYTNGTPEDYLAKYDPTWGSFKDKTRPTPGNHEYNSDPLVGYAGYFGLANVSNKEDGGLYYAWDVGNGWRAYAMNTEIDTAGAQLAWLQQDLAAHPGMRYILYTHHPRYTSGANHAPSTRICPLWNALAATGGLELVLTGHEHSYERFAKMDCAGNPSATGARSFVIGSGGNRLYPFGTAQPGSEFRNGTDYGVLELVLHDTYYEWSFIASGRGYNGTTSVVTGRAGQRLDTGQAPTNPVGGPVDRPPFVYAGVDQSVTASGPVSLDGTVTDDGLPNPPGRVTSSWSQVDGPGTVTFGDPAAVDTTATFSTGGTYVLRLTASDSASTRSDTVAVTVSPAAGGGGTQTVEVRVAAGSDDAEQRVGGSTELTSSDLELITDGTVQQVVGVRFPGLQIPAGASISKAWVQFQVDEVSTGASPLTVRIEASANPATYVGGTGTLTARPVTGGVAWSPPGWPTVNLAGADQRTPDLSGLLQTAVNRSDWKPGNAVALQFSGSGRRTAEAFEGSPTGAPLLHVEYTTSGVPAPVNEAPVVTAGPDQSVTMPGAVTLNATVTDDGLPNPPAAVTSSWSKSSGPGTVTFADASSIDTTATFSAPGSYVLELSAGDSAATGSDTVAVAVAAAPGSGGVPQTFEVRVAAGSDDAEQRVGGSTELTSSDLELVVDGSVQQVVGVRFANVRIPAGARVTRAWVQFQVDEVSSGASSLTIRVEANANPATYVAGRGTLTARAVTGGVEWSPSAWPTVNLAGADQRTPDLTTLVQTAIDRFGWASGQAIALQFSGSGRRTAEAFEGSRTGAPLLHVEYTTGG